MALPPGTVADRGVQCPAAQRVPAGRERRAVPPVRCHRRCRASLGSDARGRTSSTGSESAAGDDGVEPESRALTWTMRSSVALTLVVDSTHRNKAGKPDFRDFHRRTRELGGGSGARALPWCGGSGTMPGVPTDHDLAEVIRREKLLLDPVERSDLDHIAPRVVAGTETQWHRALPLPLG